MISFWIFIKPHTIMIFFSNENVEGKKCNGTFASLLAQTYKQNTIFESSNLWKVVFNDTRQNVQYFVIFHRSITEKLFMHQKQTNSVYHNELQFNILILPQSASFSDAGSQTIQSFYLYTLHYFFQNRYKSHLYIYSF